MDAAALNIHGQTRADDPPGVRHIAGASTKTSSVHVKSAVSGRCRQPYPNGSAA